MREEDNPPRDIQETKHWVHANLKLSAFSDISIEEMEIYELVHMHWEQFTRDGDTLHLLEAIALCFSEGLVVPPWAQAAFCDRVSKVSNEGCSWEEAFGRARPLGQHKKTFKRRDDFDLYHRIQEILAWRPGDPPLAAWLTERVTTDDAGGLWLNVGGEFGLGHRACKERYYEQKRQQLGRQVVAGIRPGHEGEVHGGRRLRRLFPLDSRISGPIHRIQVPQSSPSFPATPLGYERCEDGEKGSPPEGG